MRRSNIISVAGIAALIFGCSDQPAPTENEIAPLQLSASHGRVVQSVTGSGHFVFTPEFGKNGYLQMFTDVAHRYADGTVDGHWQFARPARPGWLDPYTMHGVITCMRIEGNQAWLGGYATGGWPSELEHNEVGWFVIDNGQGANAEPDVRSFIWISIFEGFAENWCETGEPEPWTVWPIDSGNIQVNP